VYFRTAAIAADRSAVRLGVTISKRNARRAVMRNRIKRLLREAFRRSIDNYSIDGFCPFESVILSWKKPPEHPKLIRLADVESEVAEALGKAFDFYLNKFLQRK
jgi:hypothetical protein